MVIAHGLGRTETSTTADLFPKVDSFGQAWFDAVFHAELKESDNSVLESGDRFSMDEDFIKRYEDF